MLQEGEDEYLPTIEEDGKLHISKKPKMQKKEAEEEEEAAPAAPAPANKGYT